MLSGGATLHPRNDDPDRPLHPGDIAVLVRTNAEAQVVSAHLQAAGVPVVVTGRTSVFATEAAEEWQLLLEALEQPHRTTRVRRLALSCFVGLTALDLAERGDARSPTSSGQQLRAWIKVLDERGVAALFEAVSLNQRLQERLLGQVGGERLLTDLRHIAQALYEAALQGQLGLTTLSAWLRTAPRGRRARQRRRAQPPPRLRRRGRADPHRAHQQGPRVPRRPRPLRLEPLARQGAHDRRLPRPEGRQGKGCRRSGQSRLGRTRRRAQAGGDRRRAAAHLRRADPRPVAPRPVVGAHDQHPDVAAAPADAAQRPLDRRADHYARAQ